MAAVRNARNREAWDEHLKPGTEENPQSPTDRCPSNNPYGIECPCVDASPAGRMIASPGANLFFVPAFLIVRWAEEMIRFFGSDDLMGDWILRYAHVAKLSEHFPALSKRDSSVFEQKKASPKDPNTKNVSPTDPQFYHSDAASCVVLITSGCWTKHFRKQFDVVDRVQVSKRNGTT